jgi:beta-lactam-binding protein with PASTA domain
VRISLLAPCLDQDYTGGQHQLWFRRGEGAVSSAVRRRLSRLSSTLLAVAATFAVGPAALAVVDNPPDVVGKTQATAAQEIARWGEVNKNPAVATFAPDTLPGPSDFGPVVVVQGAPDFDTRPWQVPLTLGAVMPSLVGLPRAGADDLLATAGLTRVTRSPGDALADAPVLEQEPPPGTLLGFGDPVEVVYDDPPPPDQVTVPPLVGLRLAEARAVLQASDLVLLPSRDHGRVIDQDPSAGTTVPPGSIVTVDLSTASAATTSVVPNLLGRSRAAARADVRRVDLRLDPTGRGTVVVGQRPAAGTEVPRRSTVTVELAAEIVVPDLVGIDVDDARAAVLHAGLVLAPDRDDGRVRSQRPVAGTTVLLGTAVVVSLRPEPAPPGAGRWLLGAGLLAALAAAGAGLQGVRHRRTRIWTDQHVRLRPHRAPGSGAAVDTDPRGPDLPAFGLEPRRSSAEVHLEEAREP